MPTLTQTALRWLAPVWLAGVPAGEATALTGQAGQVGLGTTRGVYCARAFGWYALAPGRGVRDLAALETGGSWLRFDPSDSDTAPKGPDLQTLHRVVMAYQELSPTHLSRVERRGRVFGLLPQLRTNFSMERGRVREREGDQTWSSGAVRNLVDSGSEHGANFQIEIQLSWDFGRLARPDEALDLSRERRSLIELRDHVLERVNRLYFEWLRVRRERRQAETRALRQDLDLRVQELSAGLDAWSGGFFSRAVERTTPRSVPRPGRLR